jgi:hypothetical protein
MALACPAVERRSPRAASLHDGDGKLKHTLPVLVPFAPGQGFRQEWQSEIND